MTIREAFLAGLSCGESGDIANYGSDWDKAADAYVAQAIPPGVASTKLMYARPMSETLRACCGPTGLALVEVPPNCAVDGATSEVQATLREIADELGELSQSAFNVRPQAWKFQDFAQRIDRVRTLLGAPTDDPFTAARAREVVGDQERHDDGCDIHSGEACSHESGCSLSFVVTGPPMVGVCPGCGIDLSALLRRGVRGHVCTEKT